ncbi:MAG: S8 family serine peptidase [Devosia sp.]
MANLDVTWPVEIFYIDEAEERRALELLQDIGVSEFTVYDSVIEAAVPSDAFDAVIGAGLIIDIPEGLPTDEPELAAGESDTAQHFPDVVIDDADQSILNMFRKSAKYVGFTKKAAKYIKDTKKLIVPPEVMLRKSPRKNEYVILDGFNIEGLDGPLQELPNPDEMLDQDVYRVRLAGRLRDAWRDEFSNIGIELITVADPTLCTIFADKEQVQKVRDLPFVRAVKRHGMVETVTESLRAALRGLDGDNARSADDDRQLEQPEVIDLVVHRTQDLEDVRELIEETTGHPVLDHSENVIRFKSNLDSPLLAALANLPHVRSIYPYRAPTLFCEHVREVVGINAINPAANGGHSLWDGAGEIVAVIDSGIDDSHPDLEYCTRTKANYGAGTVDDLAGHGTHVAGIIAGGGAASNGEIRGIAPGVKIISLGIVDNNNRLDLPVDIGRLLKQAVDLGASIINLSLGWSRNANGEYQVQGESIDRFIHQHPDILVVAAAGNEGEARQGTHKVNTLGMPATAKNVLTVGASASSRPDDTTWGQEKFSNFPKAPAADEPVSGNPDLVAALSSRGPTDADLTKPDIVAPGTRILSAKAKNARMKFHPDFSEFNGKYGFLSGTSMATPVVSGAAAIVRQYLREELGVTKCSAALLKAILIASARRLPSSPGARNPQSIGYPDFEQGYGRLDLSAIIPPRGSGSARRLYFFDVANDSDDALRARQPAGQVHKSARRYKFSIGPDAVSDLKVVLVWTDPPGLSLQNDLHISLSTSTGETIMGNAEQLIFRRAWEELTGKIGPDKNNVVEYISVVAPEEGTYRVKVLAQDTALPPQGYALCVVGDLSESLKPIY